MATGNIENWAGSTISEIGAAYPFPGMETVLFIAGLIFWVWWHITQIRAESAELDEEVRKYGDPDDLRNLLDSSDPHDV